VGSALSRAVSGRRTVASKDTLRGPMINLKVARQTGPNSDRGSITMDGNDTKNGRVVDDMSGYVNYC
jgi:hypothetical protein